MSQSDKMLSTDLAQHVAWLEHLLKPGWSITRTKRAWYLRQWQAYAGAYGYPRMDWKIIAEAPTLSALLARLGEPGQ